MATEYVFVVGCSRTGTSLLRRILNRSDKVSIAPETHFVRRFCQVGLEKRLAKLGDLSDDRSVERLVEVMYSGKGGAGSSYWEWLTNNTDRQAFVARLRDTDRSERAIFDLLMRLYAEAARGTVEGLMLGEKTPTHLYYVPILLDWFPAAKVVHTFRDPRAIAVSTVKKVEKKKRGSLRAKLPRLPAWLTERLIRPVEMLHISRAWLEAARLHGEYERKYPERYRLLRFEDLISDPENTIRGVCDFIGVPFVPEMTGQVEVINSSYLAGRHGADGFDKQVLERWRDHIGPLASAWWSLAGRRQLKRFGYPAW